MKVENHNSIPEIEIGNIEPVKAAEVGIQCTLTTSKGKLPPAFTITDIGQRRSFVRKLYGLIILQNLISLFAMEIFLRTTVKAVSKATYSTISFVMFFVFLLMYFIRRQRRKEPLNYLFFVMTTVLYISHEVMYAKMIDTELVILQPFCLIVQLTFLILFSKLYFISLTNFRGIIIILITCSLYLIFIIFWSARTIIPILLHAFVVGSYTVYDTHVMLTGQHGYELKADEYIFAATNIFADWPIFLWRVLKFFFLDHIIEIVKFFGKCCKAEVC